jgi:hypothetical protein
MKLNLHAPISLHCLVFTSVRSRRTTFRIGNNSTVHASICDAIAPNIGLKTGTIADIWRICNFLEGIYVCVCVSMRRITLLLQETWNPCSDLSLMAIINVLLFLDIPNFLTIWIENIATNSVWNIPYRSTVRDVSTSLFGNYSQQYEIWGSHCGDYEECYLLGHNNPVRTSQETLYISATKPSRIMLCKIWGFHFSDYEECRLLGGGAEKVLLELMFLRKVGSNLSQKVSHPGRRHSSQPDILLSHGEHATVSCGLYVSWILKIFSLLQHSPYVAFLSLSMQYCASFFTSCFILTRWFISI